MQQTDLVILQNRMIAKALDELSRAAVSVPFAVKVEADQLLKDIDGHPHAFVIACLMDRQIKAERAWGIPYELQQRLGSFEFPFLLQLSLQELEHAMEQPTPLHRFNTVMAKNMYTAIHHISDAYDGNAGAIWAGRPSSTTVVRRFLEFDGMGPKIANMAANILVRDFRVELADHSAIDISVDVQVRRVFSRMGFVPERASNEDVIKRVRKMYPEYPGVFDIVLWELGRTLCRPENPMCASCEWAAQCAYANTDHTLQISKEAGMKLVIIGCSKSKIWDKNPSAGPQKAGNVYVSPYFKAKRRFAESRGCDWMILSGKYGFVRPDFVIPRSYDATFNKLSTCPISVQELTRQVEEQGLGRYDEITVIGGAEYIKRIRGAFCGTRAKIEAPFAGHGIGEQEHMINQVLHEEELAQRGEPVTVTLQSVVSRHRARIGARQAATVNTETFREALRQVFNESKASFVDVTSGELYRMVGGRTGRDHKMPGCCNAMTKAMQSGDTILAKPPKGRGATLTIRYILPR